MAISCARSPRPRANVDVLISIPVAALLRTRFRHFTLTFSPVEAERASMSHIACLQLMATELRVENDPANETSPPRFFQRIQRGFPRPGRQQFFLFVGNDVGFPISQSRGESARLWTLALTMNCRSVFQTTALGWSLLLPIATGRGLAAVAGPNRDGAWNETGIMESFPPGGLKISWRARWDGAGPVPSWHKAEFTSPTSNW